MRLLYLISLYNSGQYIQKVQFLDEEINITYANNNQTQFYFEMVKPYNKDGFENRIKNNLNTMLILSKNSNIEGNEQAIVKYYLFELEEEPEEEENDGNGELIEGKDEELIEEKDEDNNKVDESNEMEEDDKEFGGKEEMINKKRKLKDLQNSKKCNKLKSAKLYKEFLLLEKGLPFFDDNAQVHKSDYYNNALSIDLYQEEQEPAVLILLEFDDGNLRDQINLLQKLPKLPSDILTNTSISFNTNDQQILIFLLL
ncbi:43852_t:CDS:2 [Gigaspora margarita]|uniref:43852_t:CDS:1 n=1 Tax=Gigaspora margarita TaxID=4874 RepID=A0ABN7VEQ7_GIGMA|nr:43852_t:CDS:2 [Gigaspora margarita]